MIATTERLSADQLRLLTGWELKPEGLCRGDECVPLRSTDADDVALDEMAERLGMPLLHDPNHGLWALGPRSSDGARFLTHTRFPDLTLPDLEGQPFSFSSLAGRKIVMVAWASW